MASLPWYREGLKFKCTECGGCCTGGPGVVWITENDIYEMADFLKMDVQEFADKYVRRVDGRYSLKEKVDSYDCIFLKDKRCTIYRVRPTQCRTFPFWPENLQSRDAWERTICEGINDEADLVPFEEIEEKRKEQVNV